ncbi:cytochrome P450 [Mycena filopes]|nr:cytochrome P450 [Mycena filopes]
MVTGELIMYYRLRNIPTVGTANFFTYFIDTWTSIWKTRDMFRDADHSTGIFSFTAVSTSSPQIGGWMIMASGTDMVEDIRPLEDIFHTGGTIGDHVYSTSLTRNIAAYFGDLHDEIVSAYNTNIPVTKEWSKVNVTNVGRSLITRATSRIFVGLPVCQDPKYEAVCINFILEVLLPVSWRPSSSSLLANIPKRVNDGIKILRPIIEERLALAEQDIDKESLPNDMISWLIDKAQGPQRTEIEQVVEQEGWTKSGVAKMYKLDSFLKEASRMVGQSTYHVTRKALKDFTFSNGIVIPAGASVSVATHHMHNDERFYPDAHLFKGFRFSDMMTFKDGKPSHQMLTTSADYLSFGYGKHACPGRFFAVNMFKIVMAHLLVTYDVRFEDEGRAHPPVTAIGNAIFRYSDVPVMARARQT